MSNLTINSTLKLATGRCYTIPRLCLGTFQLPNDVCTSACLAAFEAGYRNIDSATFYENESGLGKAIKQSGLKREDLFITSKINSVKVDGYDSTLKAVDTSLRETGLDYFDLYQVHDGVSGKERRLEMWKALIEKQKEGKIRTIGVANFGLHHFKDLQDAGLPLPAVNQVELHPYCQQREIVNFCEKNGIVIQAYTPLIRGKVDPDDAISKIAASKENVDIFQVLVRWSLQKGYIPLPRSQKAERIRHNANVYHFELSEEEMAAIDALDKGDKGAQLWNPTSAP
ncbi:Aldo/keto reductase [Clavulina sp. PMI_390]|nr:Aldo/keto reductase [Clavulina sp. PMI_390]